MIQVAALFVRPDSHYKAMPGVDAYDKNRDATSWPGGVPGVYHPPCRAWGRYKHWAKPRPGERELALWSMEKVRRFGGVIEHPATSELWKEAGCISPGVRDQFGGVLLFVDQCDFGHRAQKRTGLYVVGCNEFPEIPYGAGKVVNTIENMGRAERERTPEQFAHWLIELARKCKT